MMLPQPTQSSVVPAEQAEILPLLAHIIAGEDRDDLAWGFLIEILSRVDVPERAWHARLALRCCAVLLNRTVPDADALQSRGGRPTPLDGPADAPSAATGSAGDVAVMLRTLLRSFGDGVSLLVSPAISERLPADITTFGIAADATAEGLRMRALPFQNAGAPAGLFDARPLWRRPVDSQPADGLLVKRTPHSSYTSRAQKEAVRCLLTAPPGSVLLATLPTGGGKSLLAQLLALSILDDGGQNGGTVLVVVPTVALAIDQHRSADRLFTRQRRFGAVAYLAGDGQSAQEKEDILRRFAVGELSMLFLAPERLLSPAGQAAAAACARTGRLAALVVDEAHLLASWGARFRPQLQRLAAWRQQLLATVRKPFPTVLLSATVTRDVARRLRSLYAPDGTPFLQVEGGQLRGEPDYAVQWFGSDDARRAALRKALRHLPRPAIVYTTKIADAEALAEFLTEGPAGFKRIRTFTGDTGGREREEIIDAWRRDEVDLVVATSAFGLGIDKPDVRAVVHATLPESLDRFYQEAGRGGRDGFACLSLAYIVRADAADAQRNALSDVLSADKVVARWTAMWRKAVLPADADRPDLRRLDLTLRPDYDDSPAPGGAGTIDWNIATLLMLERAGLLDTWKLDRDAGQCWILPRRQEILESQDAFVELVSKVREEEQAANIISLQTVTRALHANAEPCLADTLCALYEIPGGGPCGRCPKCRQTAHPPATATVTGPVVSWGTLAGWPQPPSRLLRRRLGAAAIGVVTYPRAFAEQWAKGNFRSLVRVLGTLSRLGIAEYVVPENLSAAVATGLAAEDGPGLVRARSDLELGYPLLHGGIPAALLFQPDDTGPGAVACFEHACRAASIYRPECPLMLLMPDGLTLAAAPDRPLASMVDTACRIGILALEEELLALSEALPPHNRTKPDGL